MKRYQGLIIMAACVMLTISQDFNPTLQSHCSNGVLNITLHSLRPFFGVIYADGRRSRCFTHGHGAYTSTFTVPLTDIERCALIYSPRHEQYYTIVHVREHQKIILDQDRTFNVSCERVAAAVQANEAQPQQQQQQKLLRPHDTQGVTMGVYTQSHQKVHRTVFGYPYQLQIMNDDDDDFTVSGCTGFAGTNYTVELSDQNGCSRSPDLMSNFVYNPIKGVATAQLRSMFKFPDYDIIHLQCQITMCNGHCRRVDCDRRRDTPLQDVNTRQHTTAQRYTSTTVKVVEVGNQTEISVREDCRTEHGLMSVLCIVFAVLLLFAVITNVVFCYLGGFLCYQPPIGTHSDGSQSQSSPKSLSLSDRDLKTADYFAITDIGSSVYGHGGMHKRLDAYQMNTDPNQGLSPPESQQHSPGHSSGESSTRSNKFLTKTLYHVEGGNKKKKQKVSARIMY